MKDEPWVDWRNWVGFMVLFLSYSIGNVAANFWYDVKSFLPVKDFSYIICHHWGKNIMLEEMAFLVSVQIPEKMKQASCSTMTYLWCTILSMFQIPPVCFLRDQELVCLQYTETKNWVYYSCCIRCVLVMYIQIWEAKQLELYIHDFHYKIVRISILNWFGI